MSKVLASLPVGERVGIAFSGGLDTSVAVAWMREKGAVPCTYTADIGQYDEPDIASVRRARHRVRRGGRPAGRLPRRPGRGRARRPGLRRVPHPVRRSHLLQHHPARPGRHRHPARARDARGQRADLGGRLHLQGQRHRAVLPLRAAGQPRAADLQAVAGRRLRQRAGRPAGRCRSGCSPAGLPYRDAAEKAYSTDANIWGATHEAKALEHLDAGIEIVEPIMGVRFWDPAVEIAPRTSRSASSRGGR